MSMFRRHSPLPMETWERRRGLSDKTPPGRLQLLRLGDDSQVWLECLPASRIFLLRFLVRDGWDDNYVAALFPVHWGGDFVFGGELHGIEDAQHFVEVAAGGHGIDKHQFDFFVWTDDKDRAHGGLVSGGEALGGVFAFCGQHVREHG